MTQPRDFCPYRGLQPYTLEDREYFFGREEDRETIAANLLTTRLVILYGASGVGKTSVLLAGVVPDLLALPDVIVVAFRSWQDREFLEALRREIAAAVAEQAGRVIAVEERPLDDVLAGAAGATGRTVTVIFDQFEEYFFYHPAGEDESSFDAELARVVNRDDMDANVLLSLREDALALLDRFQGRIHNLFGTYLRLEHLDRDAAVQAIRRPLDRFNARPGAGAPVAVEPALVDALVAQVQTGRVTLGQAGEGQLPGGSPATAVLAPERIRVETPYLQLVLIRLWREEIDAGSRVLRAATLARLGGAERIVRTHLDTEMEDLSPEERETAALAFRQLVTPSGTKIAYTLDDLAYLVPAPGTRLAAVLTKLSEGDARILRPVQPAAGSTGPRYEIFHDVLAPAVLDWRARYAQEQQLRDEQAKLARERRRVLRLRLGVLGLLALLALIAGLALFAFSQQRAAARNAGRAQRESAISSALALAAEADRDRIGEPALLPDSVLRAADAMRRLIAVGVRSQGVDQPLRDGLVLLPRPVVTLAHDGEVSHAAFSTDGRHAATAIAGGRVQVWDTTRGWAAAAPPLTSGGDVRALAVGPDGRYVATASASTVQVWELAEEWRPLGGPLVHEHFVSRAVFSPDGRHLVTTTEYTAQVWQPGSVTPLAQLLDEKRPGVGAVAFSGDGRIIVAAGEESVHAWDVTRNFAASSPLPLPGRQPTILAVSPDGRYLAAATKSSSTSTRETVMLVWQTSGGTGAPRAWTEVARLVVDDGDVNTLGFSPDAQHLLAGVSRIITRNQSEEATRVWEVSSRREVAHLVHETGGKLLGISPDGRYLVVAGRGATARVWQIPAYAELARLQTGSPAGSAAVRPSVQSMAFSPDGQYVATMESGGRLQVWETATGVEVASRRTRGGRALSFRPDGRSLIWIDAANTLLSGPVSGEDTPRTLGQLPESYGRVRFSPDGRYLAIVLDDVVQIRHTDTGQEVKSLRHERAIRENLTAFSPDGRYLATVTVDNAVQAWDLEGAGDRPAEPRLTPPEVVVQVALGPGGRVLATAGINGALRVQPVTGGQHGPLPSKVPGVRFMAFSPDGASLIAAGTDVVQVWETAGGAEVAVLAGRATQFAVSQDRRYVATTGSDGVVRIRLSMPEDLIAEACVRLRGNLTWQEWQNYPDEKAIGRVCGPR